MKQAILTKYLGPTNTKGARVKAWCQEGSRIVNWDYLRDVDGNHEHAAGMLRLKLNWTHVAPDQWQGGTLPDGTGYCFVQVERESND